MVATKHEQEFTATIEEARGGGAYVTIPFDVNDVYGTRGQVKIAARFDGHEYRGSLAPMGGGVHVLGIRKDIRKAIGKDIGDEVRVTMRPDVSPRQVEVPKDLEKALSKNRMAKRAFDGLSYTHRKEFARWVSGAKREETRSRRVAQAVEKLVRGETL